MPDYLLKNYNGFMNKEVINFYARHVEAVVSRLKGKVKYWLTYNEINLAYCQSDLVAGAYLPDGMSKAEMFVQLNINVQIAHARAVEVIKRVDPQAKVGGMIGHAHSIHSLVKVVILLLQILKISYTTILLLIRCVKENYQIILSSMH